jgi:hypothetical protein
VSGFVGHDGRLYDASFGLQQTGKWIMKVAFKLGKMILPQLEAGAHGVEVVGMFFFEDNNYVLLEGNPIGERLAKVAKEQGMLLMGCDQCCEEREIEDKLVEGAVIGCFPNLYGALAGNMPDQVITL